MSAGWSGRVVLEPGLLVFDGEIGGATRHAHAAVQLVVVRDGVATLTDRSGRSVSGDRFVIPPGAPHAVASDGARGLMIYLDHVSDAGRAATALVDPTTPDAEGWSAAAAQLSRPRATDVRDRVREVLDSVRPHRPAPTPPTVIAATEAIRLLLHGPVRIGDVAGQVGVSPDHLGRLFRRHLGLTFPAFVRWQRLMAAAAEVRAGATLTDAAHAAGFTDSSHANRVAHEMFGVGPSEMALLVRPA